MGLGSPFEAYPGQYAQRLAEILPLQALVLKHCTRQLIALQEFAKDKPCAANRDPVALIPNNEVRGLG